MKVFKFGGASIKDAKAIENVCQIISERRKGPLLIVVSALGKTTNALENILNLKVNKENYSKKITDLKIHHLDIVNSLFKKRADNLIDVDSLFTQLEQNLSLELPYDELYDQTVSMGEIISSTIIKEYLTYKGIDSHWLDARKYIRTNDHYREGIVDWEITESLITSDIKDILHNQIVVTQGFIAGTKLGKATTLGREGSDFSGAIFASCLNAESLTVWKDVPGILNADPKIDPKAKMYDELPYNEAAEMTFYGASVIHPKTIKPLANKRIPLYVRSFIEYESDGTVIRDCVVENILPAFIVKKDQCLLSFKVIDYSFINEENLSLIFKKLSDLDMKINIMQNSAISFSVSIDYHSNKLNGLLEALKDSFDIRYNTGLQLITIKNYTPSIIDRYRQNKKILLEQISRNNYRALIQPS
ncbi:MAG: aspartate kinase [Bacteroidota bacterium]